MSFGGYLDPVSSIPLESRATASREILRLIGSACDAIVTSIDRTTIESRESIAGELVREELALDYGPTIDALQGRIGRIIFQSGKSYEVLRRCCERLGVCSVLSVPIMTKGSVVGALTVVSEDHHAFGADEIRATRMIASQLAAVIAECRHFESTNTPAV